MPAGVEVPEIRRAKALRSQGRPSEAMAELATVISRNPDCAEAHHQLGNLLKRAGRLDEARESLKTAARLAPGEATIWLNLGGACLEAGATDHAIACFGWAVAIDPRRSEAHNILGHALLCRGRCSEAAEHLETALRLRPGYPAAHDNLGRVLKAQGRAADAVAHHRAALEGEAKSATHSNLLYTLNLLPGVDPGEIAVEHRQWALLHAKPPGRIRALATGGNLEGNPAPSRRLRVGYVSPDFCHHAVAYFLEPLLAAHDPRAFEIFCYSDVRVPDEVTRRLRASAGHWRDIARSDDDAVEVTVRSDAIDILVDLAGHTARNRLLVFARKPAPVQATWLGYPATTGLDAIDYRITDAVCDPPGRTEAWHSEELVRVPGPFLCYGPPADSPPVGALPAPAAGGITFGCFNNLAKINGPAMDLWARIVLGLPSSRLFLKSRGLGDPATAAAIRAEFLRRGVAPERIALEGGELSVPRHLALYHRVDIALDAFPYNGVTTTCEALWMGVPVVTLAGRSHVSRTGASLLSHLGAPEWIADSPGACERICRRLAADWTGLAALRAGLRERVRSSPLCDGPGFARRLEDAYRRMWLTQARKCEGPGRTGALLD